MKKNLAILGGTVASLLMPAVVFAQDSLSNLCSGIGFGSAEGLVCKVYDIVRIVIPLLILGAVGYFIYGIFNYIKAEGDDAKSKGKTLMINGIIGFAVILGLWGLVSVLLQTFGLGGGTVNEGAFPTF